MNNGPLLFTSDTGSLLSAFLMHSFHLPFNSPTDGFRTSTVLPDEKHLNISVINILVINPLRISRCATVGYSSFTGSRRCSSQVKHPSVASISEPLPLRSLRPLCLFLSVMRSDLEWKALGCMPNEEKEQQPAVLRVSNVCTAENFSEDTGHWKHPPARPCTE